MNYCINNKLNQAFFNKKRNIIKNINKMQVLLKTNFIKKLFLLIFSLIDHKKILIDYFIHTRM